jgi:putative transposase
MHYRRANAAVATDFFTVNLADRSSDLWVRNIGTLRHVTRAVRESHTFTMAAMEVLPDRLHAIWRLQPGMLNARRIGRIRPCTVSPGWDG